METQAASACLLSEADPTPVLPFRKPMENASALRQVFEKEESALLRFAFGLVGQRETAEDLVQEAFLKLHAHWNEVENPRAWLYRAVRNLALNHIRDHRRETPMIEGNDPACAAPDPERALGRMEAVGTLRMLLSELREEDQRLIGLKYHEGLKYGQISERTGLSVGNVGYKLHHVLKHLGDALRRLGVEGAEG
ncbi:MAG TPA: RNA polymerase sigma factor [Luteolibacter sp.]|nr:RNA polymerase sigma factor [Luteolibacter sp.]